MANTSSWSTYFLLSDPHWISPPSPILLDVSILFLTLFAIQCSQMKGFSKKNPYAYRFPENTNFLKIPASEPLGSFQSYFDKLRIHFCLFQSQLIHSRAVHVYAWIFFFQRSGMYLTVIQNFYLRTLNQWLGDSRLHSYMQSMFTSFFLQHQTSWNVSVLSYSSSGSKTGKINTTIIFISSRKIFHSGHLHTDIQGDSLTLRSETFFLPILSFPHSSLPFTPVRTVNFLISISVLWLSFRHSLILVLRLQKLFPHSRLSLQHFRSTKSFPFIQTSFFSVEKIIIGIITLVK